MTHDESVYPDPFTFKPEERFFDANGKLNDDNRVLAYGFGRRICVGKAVASDIFINSLDKWIMISDVSFLACFKAKDEFGQEIEIDDSFNEFGVVIHKKSFKGNDTPRSEQIRKVIDSTVNH